MSESYIGVGFRGGTEGTDTLCGSVSIDVRDAHLAVLEGNPRLPRHGEANAEEIHCALVLDLGNSRTAGLIIEDYDGDDFHVLPLRLADPHSSGDVEDGNGVFESVMAGEWREEDQRPQSLFRLGKTARTLEKWARSKVPIGYDVFCSSPKRFFWDRGNGAYGFSIRKSGGQGVENVRTDIPNPPEVRADLIGEMVVELLEQAEGQINRWARDEGATVSRPGWRRVTCVALTYPTSWTKAERNEYKKCIQLVLDRRWSRPLGLPTPVRVMLTVDEATAVLLAYLHNGMDDFDQSHRIHREGENANRGIEWMRKELHAREERHDIPGSPSYWTARVAVLDVGGGTSDLAVARVEGRPGRLDGVIVDVQIENENGICVAGNDFIKAVLEEVVIPLVVNRFEEQIEGSSKAIQEKLSGGGADAVRLRVRYCRDFLNDLALAVATKDNKLFQKAQESLFDQTSGLPSLLEGQAKLSAKSIDSIKNQLWADLSEKTDLSDLVVETLVKATFKDSVIRPFSDMLRGTPPDVILLSGKPFAIPSVRKVIVDGISREAASSCADGNASDSNRRNPGGHMGTIRPLEECGKLSPFWSERYAEGKFDVKLMTVVGGAISFLKCQDIRAKAASLPVIEELRDHPYEEGKASTFWKAIILRNFHGLTYIGDQVLDVLSQDNRDASFPLDKVLGLVRRRGNLSSMPAQLGYKLIRTGGRAGDDVRVHMEDDESLSLEQKSVARLEMCMDTGERNWMDTGSIDVTKPL